MEKYEERLRRQPYAESLFLPGGRLPRPGEILRQPDLARTLERIAHLGEDGFYRGEPARALVATLQRLGGGMTLDDLAGYRPEERPPLRGSYRGLEVLTVPAPSAGGVALMEMLHILEGFDLAASGQGTPATFHLLASAMKLAFFDRNRHVGDPAFVEVPTARLTSRNHAAAQRARIPAERSLPSADLGPARPAARESAETTHLSVLDARGGAVSLTTTLNSTFGSGLAAEGLGYLLNNEMDDFATAPGHPNLYGLVEGEANTVAPGKRMASSMCPTVILRDSEPYLVLGSPGGPRIPNAVLQVILNVVDFGADLEGAVAAPRIHHQWLPDVLTLEEGGFPAATTAALEAMGYELGTRRYVGNVQVAGTDPATGAASGAADPRRYGAAARAGPAAAARGAP
jgi:gamma-glutamyltranspeptidase/glutathione hydrolase